MLTGAGLGATLVETGDGELLDWLSEESDSIATDSESSAEASDWESMYDWPKTAPQATTKTEAAAAAIRFRKVRLRCSRRSLMQGC